MDDVLEVDDEVTALQLTDVQMGGRVGGHPIPRRKLMDYCIVNGKGFMVPLKNGCQNRAFLGIITALDGQPMDAMQDYDSDSDEAPIPAVDHPLLQVRLSKPIAVTHWEYEGGTSASSPRRLVLTSANAKYECAEPFPPYEEVLSRGCVPREQVRMDTDVVEGNEARTAQATAGRADDASGRDAAAPATATTATATAVAAAAGAAAAALAAAGDEAGCGRGSLTPEKREGVKVGATFYQILGT